MKGVEPKSIHYLPHRIGDLEIAILSIEPKQRLPHRIGDLETKK